MKFTPEIIAALETLKNAAENDFERHRIDVLENDLTQPPEVEQIDENHQIFLGVTYHREKHGSYRQVIGVHQAVYEYYYGEVPKGYHIHHIDCDKSNNLITNLQMLTKTEHIKIHRPKGYDMATHQKKTFICEVCEKEYQAHCSGKNRFCSPECRKKQFTKICSTECRFKSMAKTKKANYSEERLCPICGKKFVVPRYDDTKTCSPECGHVLTALNRKAHSWGIGDVS